MKKRGFQISIGMMVILILTIIIFIGSLYFIRQFYVQTEEFRTTIDENTQAQLEALIRDGSIVAIPINKAKLNRGSGATFGLGIQNILKEQRDFKIKVQFSKAFTLDEVLIDQADGSYINENWILYSTAPVTIQNNEFKSVPIAIVVGESTDYSQTRTEDGIYSFNVCVWDTSVVSDIGECAPGVQNTYPNNKVFKIFVEVD